MAKRVSNRLTKTVAPAKQIVVDRVPGPNKTVVRTPTTLAEAIGDPVVVVPDEPPTEPKVIRRTVRRRRAA